MAKATSDGTLKGRLVDLSKGMVDVIHPALLNDAESKLLKNASLDEKGTLKPCLGRTERFASPFDPANPCNGIYSFYPDTATSRLIMGAGTKLFKDTPHLLTRWDTEADWGNWSVSGGIDKTGGTLKLAKEYGIATLGTTTTTGSGSTAYEMGWKFTVGSAPVKVTGLRVNAAISGSITARLWKVSDSSKLKEVAITAVANSWREGYFEPVELAAGASYVVSISVPTNTNYKKIGKTSNTYNSRITCNEGRRATTQGSFPATVDSTYIYGMVDLVIMPTLAASFSRPSVAYKQDGAQVAANVPRFEPGRFGNPGAIMVEEGTTPKLLNGFFVTDSNADGLCDNWEKVYNLAGAAWSQVNITGWGGKAQRCEITGAYTSSLLGVVQLFSVTAGSPISVRCIGKTSRNVVRILLRDETNAVNFLTQDFVVTPGVQFDVSVSSTVPAGCVSISAYFVTWPPLWDTANWTVGDYIELYAAHVEDKLYSTSPTDVTRSAETLTIPTAGVLDPQEGTIEGWFYLNDTSSAHYSPLFTTADVAAPGPRLLIMRDLGSGKLTVWDGDGTSESVYTGTTVIQPKTWYHFAFTWSSTGRKLYLNGVLEATGTRTTPIGMSANAGIGNWGSHYLNGLIDDLRISSRARTDAEISAAYNSNQPLPVDEWTTCKLPFDNTLASIAQNNYVVSPSIDVSAAQSTVSGKITYAAELSGTAGVVVKTRSSPDGLTWGAWTGIDAEGNIQSPYEHYIQVLVTLTGDNGLNSPVIDSMTLSYDGTPSAQELATGFTAGGQFYFATLLSKCVVMNKLNVPKVWDGINPMSDLAGSPPHAQYVAAHKNYLFAAHTNQCPSRLYFSDVLNIESWPALNFIDISPNDGDWITGLLPYDDYLIITKNRSVWVLVGSGPSDFEVRRIHDGIGCIAPRSLCKMGEVFSFVAHDGIYVSDLSAPKLISERIKKTWQGLNQRRLFQACAAYFNHKLRVDVPNGSSTINNLRIIYDAIRQALFLEEFVDHASCYCKYVEAGQEVLLYGHANEGQVSQADSGTSDAGSPINFIWESKHFDFGVPEHIKRWRKVYMEFAPAASDTTVNVSFVVDGGNPSSPIQLTIPGDTTKKVHTVRLLPSQVGVVQGHSLGFRVTQSTANGGVGIHATILDYFVKGARPTI